MSNLLSPTTAYIINTAVRISKLALHCIGDRGISASSSSSVEKTNQTLTPPAPGPPEASSFLENEERYK